MSAYLIITYFVLPVIKFLAWMWLFVKIKPEGWGDTVALFGSGIVIFLRPGDIQALFHINP